MIHDSTRSTYQNQFEKFKACVIIPTYNNDGTLQQVLDGVLSYTHSVIVVNDGSTDRTNDILKTFPQVKQVNFQSNKGKGWALRKGFDFAILQGYHYAITIDSDGQHFPSDLPKFLDKLEKEGSCLIIGARNMDQSSVPGKSSFGNKFSNFWFWVETGIKAPDTQSGYRLYPIDLLQDTNYFSRKFEFEIEVIVRAAWNGIKIESVPVTVFYAPPGERVSHFRPFTDFTRISILNTVLVFITFFYINPRNFFRAIFKKETYKHLKKELFNPDEPAGLTAASVAFGVFMGVVPIWGFQMLTAMAFAVFFRLNKALVLVSANISIPPMIPFIIYLSYKMGAIWTGESSVPLKFDSSISLDTIHLNFMQYIYGSITLAIILGLFSGIATWITFAYKQKTKISVNK